MKHCSVLAAVFMACVALVWADGPTGTLTLSGTVNRVVSISVTPQNNFNSLDLVNGESGKVVGLVNERSNDKAGYTLILTSAGAGTSTQPLLKPLTPGNSSTVPYSITYAGTPVVLSRGSAILRNASKRTGSSGSVNFLTVTIPPAAGVTADSYSDNLTLLIQGN